MREKEDRQQAELKAKLARRRAASVPGIYIVYRAASVPGTIAHDPMMTAINCWVHVGVVASPDVCV